MSHHIHYNQGMTSVYEGERAQCPVCNPLPGLHLSSCERPEASWWSEFEQANPLLSAVANALLLTLILAGACFLLWFVATWLNPAA